MAKHNPYIGPSLDDLLEETGELAEVNARAIEQVVAWETTQKEKEADSKREALRAALTDADSKREELRAALTDADSKLKALRAALTDGEESDDAGELNMNAIRQ